MIPLSTIAHFKSKVLLATLFLTGFALSVSAAPIQLTPTGTTVLADYYINKNGTGPGNGNDSASNLYRLNTYFLGPDIVPTASWKPDDQTNVWPTGLEDWDYAVIHFGAGAFGGAGGSIGAWYLNGASSFTFPSKAFSSIDLFRSRPDTPRVPDGGATALLLGAGLVSLSVVARRRNRSA